METIGERIIELCKQLNINKSEGARRIGISQGYFSQIINGKREASATVIKGLATAFNEFNLDWLLFGIGTMYRRVPLRILDESVKMVEEPNAEYLPAQKIPKLQDIVGLQFYSLKDSLAIHMLDNGVDPESAMRHLRQNDLSVFQRYVKRLGVVNEKVRKMPVAVLPDFS